MKEKQAKGYVFVIISAIIYGCMPLMAKYIYLDGVNPLTLVFLRNFLALPFLAVFAIIKDKNLNIPKDVIPPISIISFLGCTITPILLFSSYQYLASGTATVFHFIYPAVVVLCELLIFRKKAKLGNILGVILCISGICCFYTPGQTPSLKGSLFALGSGVLFASYVLSLSFFKQKMGAGLKFSFYIALASSVFTLIIGVFTNTIMLPSSLNGWILCLVFANLVTTGAVVLFQQGAFIIGSEKASILSAIEPATSVVVGAIIFLEPMSIPVIIGSILVISASIVVITKPL
ncbi:MAG: DMT family transporter [Clostridiales bacterium]|nr:DMT family transporter [Clostridiales bacterium]